MPEDRRPGQVPDRVDDGGAPAEVTEGLDTDGDGRADTLVTTDGFDLLVLTDLDGDGLADQILRIGPDAVVRHADPGPDPDHVPQAAPGTGIGDPPVG